MQGRYLLTLKNIVKVISAGSGPLRSVCHRFGLFVSARNKDRLTGFYIKSSVASLNTNWLVYIRLNTIQVTLDWMENFGNLTTVKDVIFKSIEFIHADARHDKWGFLNITDGPEVSHLKVHHIKDLTLPKALKTFENTGYNPINDFRVSIVVTYY